MMNEEQQAVNGGDADIVDLKGFNLFYTSLSRVTNDFHSDIEQIGLLLGNSSIQMPSYGYNEQLEHSIPTLQQWYSSMNDMKDDDFVIHSTEGMRDLKITKGDLRAVIEVIKTRLVKNKRNRNFLQIIAFNHLVSLFDAAMQDFAMLVFKYHPLSMVPRDKGVVMPNLNYLQIFQAGSFERVTEIMRERELDDFGRLSVRQQLILFNKILNNYLPGVAKVKVSLEIDKQIIASVIEMKETRNIHVHNKGIVNKQYKTKIDEYINEVNKNVKDESKKFQFFSPYSYTNEGDFRYVTDSYVNDAISKFSSVLSLVYDAIVEKFISKEEQERIRIKEAEIWERNEEAVNTAADINATPPDSENAK